MLNKSKFNLLEYAYYTFTKFYMKYESKEGIQDNKITGAYFIGLLIGLNILSVIFLVISLSFKKSSVPENFTLFFVPVPIIITVYLIYYFVKKKHNYIFNKYESLSQKKKNIRNFYVFLYIVMSVLLMIFTVYIGRNNFVD